MQFSRCDTTKPDGFYVQIVRVIDLKATLAAMHDPIYEEA